MSADDGQIDGRLEAAITAMATTSDLRLIDLVEIAAVVATWPTVFPQLRTEELAHFVASRDTGDATNVSIRRVVGYYPAPHELEPDDDTESPSWLDIGVEFTMAMPFRAADGLTDAMEFMATCSLPSKTVEDGSDLLRCGEWLTLVAQFVAGVPAGTGIAYRPYRPED